MKLPSLIFRNLSENSFSSIEFRGCAYVCFNKLDVIMAVSKKGQGSSNACPKTANVKRRANKTTKTATRLVHVNHVTTEKNSVPKEVGEASTEWLWYAFVAAAAVACYAKTPFGELVHDDIFAIERNADIRPEAPLSALFLNDYWGKSLKSPESHKSYRPLCVLSFRAQFWLHGLRPFGYRFVNVLLHIAVCLSLVRLCEGVLACSKRFSDMTGLVFAVHPIHAEPVRVVQAAYYCYAMNGHLLLMTE